MVSRKVTKTRKDDDGDILALCNDNAIWSPKMKKDAIREIDIGDYRYYVIVDGKEVDIHVFKKGNKEHLRTNRDETKKNNLDELPDC